MVLAIPGRDWHLDLATVFRPGGEAEVSAIHRPDTRRQWWAMVHLRPDTADKGAGDKGGTWIQIHKCGRKRKEVSTTNLLQFALNIRDAPPADAPGLSIQSSEPGDSTRWTEVLWELPVLLLPWACTYTTNPRPEAALPVCFPFLSLCRMLRPSFFAHAGVLSGPVSTLFSSKGAAFFQKTPPPFLI